MESFDELFALCERAIEGTLDDSGRKVLERLVLQDPNARRVYVEYMHQHASLIEGKQAVLIGSQPSGTRIRPRWRRTSSRILAPLAMVAGIVLGVGLGRRALTKDQVIATLEISAQAQWYGATLPTMNGSRLTPGRLRLASGVATIRFDSGARVILEDSSDIELLSSGECRLYWGSMVAIVATPGDTFTIKTGSSVITAQTGSVGVVANAGAGSQVMVFNGQAQARHTNTGKTFQLEAGSGALFDSRNAQAQQNTSPEVSNPESQSIRGDDLETITTSMGRGRTGYVQSGPKSWRQGISSWSSVLQVKNTTKGDYHRIAYLTFDLATMKDKQVREASLSLSIVPSGHGHAAFVPDANFSVYAVVDDALDGWDPDTIEWYDAPGRTSGLEGMDPKKVTRIASFQIPQGVVVGNVPITSPALLERIQHDGNGLLTLVVVRDTLETQNGGYVHGFAGNEHAAAAAPTLRLTVGKPGR